MARTLSFIYDRFDRNCLADMLEESTSDCVTGKPAKNTCTIITVPFSTLYSIFYRLDPIAVASTFHQILLFRSLLYFYFWFAFSNWSTDISMDLVYSYLKELHQGRCLVADQLHNIMGLSIKGETFTFGKNAKERFLRQYLVFFNIYFYKIKYHTSINILSQKSRFEENYRSEDIL